MKKADIRANRRGMIFEAALHCFNENGYYRTSMDAIAERAGITKRGLYYHFKSKDELFIELFHHRGKKYFAQINSFIRDVEDPEERMRLFVRKGSQILQENEDFLRFFIEFMSIGTRKTEVRKVMTEHYKDSIINFKHLLEEGIKSGKFKDHDPGKIARTVFLLSMGSFFTYFSLDTDFNLVDQHIFNIDQILSNIKKVPKVN
jgi:AcrR family transcriptional regulator